MKIVKFVCFNSLLAGVWSYHLATAKPDQTCGVEASSSLLHRNPWMVYLEFWRREQTEIRCGATLIDDQHLVTAAHCTTIKYSSLVARLGEYDTTTEKDCVDEVCSEGAVRIEVEEVFVHPQYDGTVHDIAVLKLKKPAPYTDMIRPICLPTTQFTNVNFLASGWGEDIELGGYSKTKKIIPLPSWTKEECQSVYGSNVPENVICAGGEKGVDTCRGDSGGPLTLARETVELWGVTSMGNIECGKEGSPGMYTNVKDHLDWILEMVQK